MLVGILLALTATVADLPPAAMGPVDFVRDIQPIFQQACLKCHGPEKQKGGFRLDVKAAALKGGDSDTPSIVPGDSAGSPLIQFVAQIDPDIKMPPQGAPLTSEQVGLLRAWIDRGAVWPDSASAQSEDALKTHWAFQPVRRPAVPTIEGGSPTATRQPIDAFIAAKLAEKRLVLAPEADKRTLVRRLYLVLHGLPPTPEEVAAFVADDRPGAYEELVDRLLDSPRYGERWARHWLDIMAFGETDGFEVNTPRDNAWPYRDYVIRALNADKPYPEFIKDQLVGDATGEDAATGFIVAKAALLPGQTGRDIESIRLARQDQLNDMVLNAGSTFLGLTIHCARCHDHKFDPISQRDYYAMTAIFAGVRHGERPLRSADDKERQLEAKSLKPRIVALETDLAKYEPLASPSIEPKPIDPRLNQEMFPPTRAKFVRFTIQDANLHPSFGLIEPCLDELEIFTTDETNVALATTGAKASASGTFPGSNFHRLEHVNDGKYGNERSWISDEKGRGWILVELPEEVRVHRIAWSRDRQGVYVDRLATAYTIEAGPSLDAMRLVVSRLPLRSAVSPRLTVDRFRPVAAKRLRFTILASNSIEPCLDELEVFTAGPQPRNVALASAGAKTKASGTYPGSAIHRLEHLNDGRYGNGRSWISNENGRGWVEVEFPETTMIDRVVWARDREEAYADRLATRYRIEVADESGDWTLVATSEDRRPYVPGASSYAVESTAGLDEAEIKTLHALQEEKRTLEQRVAELTRSAMVYAGIFANPDETFRLSRGDPMQRREPIGPGAIAQLPPKLELPADASERVRRLALANWIADPENPLTARVMVNRLWHYHFGEGLVNTPSDFGRNGARPVNGPLLDWLASEFVARGWSLKAMHRLLVTSATFRQSSRPRAAAIAVDSGTRLLWRYPPRRLEAEAIRDSILAVAGTLDLRMGGPGYSAFAPNTNYVRVYNPKTEYGPADWRRMIYQTKVRMAQDSTFGAFDCPDAGQNQPSRPRSTTPLQALNLFNSEFVAQQAGHLADRLKREAGEDSARQIHLAYRLALGREPDDAETRLCAELVKEQDLATFCRVLLNTNEFLFVP
ncbi:DUF1553 domain-containing protein [Singulisphaera acidiphila]|uniref:Cytochrome c domain-containing protein n=1 Tax=Singulisphaera acidiphila (strain ATCC BAA-1392 / DSM 18658 / VKM B-2454 / MOB10) TaxID=886293 RepID=L0DFK0_SINAD|nr:DUF1553 domain-containing protein [Singulisphaera acidiphila]AGA27635.1 Protein of unknown function (DUF1553)/Protein of unknown function (DUF1549)/Planctomycete cytochrome C [Singulisphaera acidiphila DSM 18658]